MITLQVTPPEGELLSHTLGYFTSPDGGSGINTPCCERPAPVPDTSQQFTEFSVRRNSTDCRTWEI